MDPRQHDLPVAAIDQFLGLGLYAVQRTRFHRSTGIGYDAVRAEILAAILDFQKSPRALRHIVQRDILENPRLKSVVYILENRLRHSCRRAVLAQCLLDIIDDAVSFPRPEHHAHTLDFLDLLRRHLGIAAADRHDRPLILPVRPPDDLPRLLIPETRDRAGVDDVGIRRTVKRHDIEPRLPEKPLKALRLHLIHLAPKCHESNAWQKSSLLNSKQLFRIYGSVTGDTGRTRRGLAQWKCRQ